MAVALDGDAGDELADPSAGQAEPLGHSPLAQRSTRRDRRHVGRPDRLLHVTRHLWHVWPIDGRLCARARLTCCMAISNAPMNATAGQAEIRAPSSPYPAPKAMFAPIVAPMLSHSMNRASPGASRPVTLFFLLAAWVADLDRGVVGELAVVVLVVVVHAGSFQEPGGQYVSSGIFS
jgi:hypothetical protein